MNITLARTPTAARRANAGDLAGPQTGAQCADVPQGMKDDGGGQAPTPFTVHSSPPAGHGNTNHNPERKP